MTRGAAFFDLDGTLLSTNLVHAFFYYARNDHGLWRSVRKTAQTVLGIPLFFAANLYDRQVFNEIFFRWYRGEHEDRLRFLSEKLFQDVLADAIFAGVPDLLRATREAGLMPVLVTGAPEFTVRPIVRHLGITEWVSNRLEFVDGYATGKLVPPVMAIATKSAWIRRYCEEKALRLTDCHAYADSFSDLPMLSMVGHPNAVNPDTRLRRTALRHDWPVLDLR